MRSTRRPGTGYRNSGQGKDQAFSYFWGKIERDDLAFGADWYLLGNLDEADLLFVRERENPVDVELGVTVVHGQQAGLFLNRGVDGFHRENGSGRPGTGKAFGKATMGSVVPPRTGERMWSIEQ